MNLVELDQALRKLRLSGMADVLDTRLQQAQVEQMAPILWAAPAALWVFPDCGRGIAGPVRVGLRPGRPGTMSRWVVTSSVFLPSSPFGTGTPGGVRLAVGSLSLSGS